MSNAQFAPLPPKEAIKFFKSKGYAFSFDWHDVWKEEHAIAFTVAKAASIDILQDIRGELQKSLEQGLTFESFKKNLKPILCQKGWWGKAVQTDPLTGEEKEVMLGSNRRLETIWRTNMDMAYAAGNWQHYEDTKKTHPYLKYHCMNLPTSRAQHRAWDGIVLPVDDPWWDTHTPPNGWRCKCWLQQVSRNAVTTGKVKVSKRPVDEFELYHNKRTGDVTRVPKGIAPGFDYNVGKARARAYTPPPLGGVPETVQNSLTQLPPLPKPSKLPQNAILPDNLDDSQYISAFLKEFGGSVGKTVFFEDKAGDMMPINEDLFLSRNKNVKANKFGRGPYMLLLANGLKDPDEIWLQWVRINSGQWVLKKRYFKIWAGKDGSHCLTIFDKSQDGWVGTTTFVPKEGKTQEAKDTYFNKYRDGLLLYKK
jgi:phage putative head morphogenesis protein, SPP1 gp7|nr:MAG TPA: minor capsid component [Caudoviricetes sp.]